MIEIIKNLYKITGAPKNATAEEILVMRKKLLNKAKIHPDQGGTDDRYIAWEAAFKVLSDPARKAEYDEGRSTIRGMLPAVFQKTEGENTKETTGFFGSDEEFRTYRKKAQKEYPGFSEDHIKLSFLKEKIEASFDNPKEFAKYFDLLRGLKGKEANQIRKECLQGFFQQQEKSITDIIYKEDFGRWEPTVFAKKIDNIVGLAERFPEINKREIKKMKKRIIGFYLKRIIEKKVVPIFQKIVDENPSEEDRYKYSNDWRSANDVFNDVIVSSNEVDFLITWTEWYPQARKLCLDSAKIIGVEFAKKHPKTKINVSSRTSLKSAVREAVANFTEQLKFLGGSKDKTGAENRRGLPGGTKSKQLIN
ncbi:MAG: hypothetical protein ABIE14_02705 [Patescibacteria group bacterium]